MSRGTAIFADTSIQIARLVHATQIKNLIKDRLAQYDLCVTSLVIKQEFKRRLLEEVVWCLNQLNHPSNPKSYSELTRHISDFTPPQRERQKRIRQQILQTVLEGPTDDLTERARRHLRTMIRTALFLFDEENGHIITDSECSCASYPVVEVKPGKKYDLMPHRCLDCSRACGVDRFLSARSATLEELRNRLKELPTEKKISKAGVLTELGKIEDFINQLALHVPAQTHSPCLTVGDLIIALESANIPNFYTINAKESQYFCRWLDQTLIVRKHYYVHPDVICDRLKAKWPEF